MSEAKPTPGPWVVTASSVLPRDGVIFIEASGKIIGAAAAHPVYFSVEEQEQEANARLMASAPDLLDALRTLIEVCQTFGVGEDRLPAAIAAIDRSEGKL